VAERLLNEARDFVYRVRSSSCLAVGSSFDSTAGIITNRHVAAGSATLALSTWSGSDFQAQVSAISHGPDLALLSSAHVALQPATIDTGPITPGTPVWVAGYPRGNQLAIRGGRVLRLLNGKPLHLPGRLLEVSARVRHGNSGGPLLNAIGQVVGVVFALLRRNGHGLAVPASDLRDFLAAPGHFTDIGCIE
jgi:S1-C subfamily serine protease